MKTVPSVFFINIILGLGLIMMICVRGDDEGGVETGPIFRQQPAAVRLIGRRLLPSFFKDFGGGGVRLRRGFTYDGDARRVQLLQHVANMEAGHSAAADESGLNG